MKSKIVFPILLIITTFLVFVPAAPAWAAGGEVAAVVFTWKNMGLMGPGDVSEHYVSVTRVSNVIQHGIDYHEGEKVQKIVLYRTDDGARFRLLDALGYAAEGWAANYEEEIMDGSSWRVALHYADGAYKEFEGYGATPPGSEMIKEQVLNLAEYEVKPRLF